MGFNLELHLLYHEKENGRSIWRLRETIDFGRVTRLEKIASPRFAHLHSGFSGHERASICAVSILLGELFAKHSERPEEVTAPRFLVYEYDRDEALAATSGDVIDPGSTLDVKIKGSPRKLEEHNAFLTLDPDARAAKLEQYHPVLHTPFLWEHAPVLAWWLEKAETENTDEWRQAQKDSLALALVRSWHFHLHHVGSAGRARALFSFPF